MWRGLKIAGAASFVSLLAVVPAASASSTPTPLLLPQSTAFSVLGHSCGGIGEQAFATGFDATSAYPTGDVFLQTSCSSGGRGSRPSTYTAWVGATWDFTGAVVSDAVLSSAPSVDPTFSAFDANGNEVYNASNNAYLVLAPTFVPTPRVTAVSSSSGPASGGTTLTISGTGFTGATGVAFGTVAAASFSVSGDTSITAVSPQTSAGTVDVTVTTAGGQSASSTSDQFTFIAAPSVSGLTPNSGSLKGGTTVTISGANFAGASAVYFGDTTVGFTVNGSTITAVSPPGEQQGDTVSVTVTTPGGTSPGGSVSQFTYVTTSPAVSVSPKSGPVGTAVKVSGSKFSPGVAIDVTYATGLASPNPVSVKLCTATASATGTFSCTGTIPVTTAGATGPHKILASAPAVPARARTTFSLT